MFISEFTSFLEVLSLSLGDLCMFGDFNFHVDNPKDSSSVRFLNLLDVFGFRQNVCSPTHEHGHTLDLVITRSSENIICDINVHNPMISDHHAVLFRLVVDKPSFRKEKHVFRSWKKIDNASLCSDISSIMNTNNYSNIEEIVSTYNNDLRQLVDKYAPVKEKMVTIRPNAPWYNKDINVAKRLRRKFEHKWLKSGLDSDKLDYKKQCKIVSEMVLDSKKVYYKDKIDSAHGNSKELFKIINNVFHKCTDPILPVHNSLDELVNTFADFYVSKIDRIRENIQSSGNTHSRFSSLDYCNVDNLITEFEPASEEEIYTLVMNSPNKSCCLDPLPTWLFKICAESIIPLITVIVNMSLSTATMPRDLKVAMLIPLIKNIVLNPDILNNFRPISNLPFISKIIEKVIASRLNPHMNSNNLHEVMQSSYTKKITALKQL